MMTWYGFGALVTLTKTMKPLSFLFLGMCLSLLSCKGERVVIKHPDSKARITGRLLDEERHGMWRLRSAKGRVIQKGRYERGQKVGRWVEYFPYYDQHNWGVKLEEWMITPFYNVIERNPEASFEDDPLYGELITTAEVDDLLHLLETGQDAFYGQHSCRMKGRYLEGEREGLWEVYRGKRHIQTRPYQGGVLNGRWTEYYYSRGKKLKDKVLLQGQVKNEKREGTWKYYYWDRMGGRKTPFHLRYTVIASYENGQLVGPVELWEKPRWNVPVEDSLLTQRAFYDAEGWLTRMEEWRYEDARTGRSATGNIELTGKKISNKREGLLHGPQYSMRKLKDEWDTTRVEHYIDGLIQYSVQFGNDTSFYHYSYDSIYVITVDDGSNVDPYFNGLWRGVADQRDSLLKVVKVNHFLRAVRVNDSVITYQPVTSPYPGERITKPYRVGPIAFNVVQDSSGKTLREYYSLPYQLGERYPWGGSGRGLMWLERSFTDSLIQERYYQGLSIAINYQNGKKETTTRLMRVRQLDLDGRVISDESVERHMRLLKGQYPTIDEAPYLRGRSYR